MPGGTVQGGGTIPTTPSMGLNDVTSGGVTMPQWYQQLSGNLASGVNNAATAAGNLSSNWYDQPVAAPTTDLQNAAAGSAATPYNPNPGLGLAQGTLNNFTTSANYDPNVINSYMDPYTGGQMNALAQQEHTNLQNYELPAVNSTFTGAGQFGSTRNGDFLQHTIQGSDQNLLNAQAGLLNTDYMNAQNQFNTMNQNNITGSAAQSGLTTATQNANWANTNNQYNVGSQLQNSEQSQLNNNYQNWLNEQQIPQNQLAALTQTLPAISQMYSKMPVSTSSAITPLTATGGAGGLGQIALAAGNLLQP